MYVYIMDEWNIYIYTCVWWMKWSMNDVFWQSGPALTCRTVFGPTRNKKIVLILTTISKLYTHVPYEKTQYKKIKWDQTGPLCRKKSQWNEVKWSRSVELKKEWYSYALALLPSFSTLDNTVRMYMYTMYIIPCILLCIIAVIQLCVVVKHGRTVKCNSSISMLTYTCMRLLQINDKSWYMLNFT